jgi:hypothetical protein
MSARGSNGPVGRNSTPPRKELRPIWRKLLDDGAQCANPRHRYFFGTGDGALLGVSQQGFSSILPLALHLYRPFFSFTHIVSFGSAANAVDTKASKARAERNLTFLV